MKQNVTYAKLKLDDNVKALLNDFCAKNYWSTSSAVTVMVTEYLNKLYDILNKKDEE